jgi:hypothetical protein
VGSGRGRKFPAEVIARGADYARGRRKAGAAWEVIAKELGVVSPTVQRWAREGKEATTTGFHSVAVRDAGPRGSFSVVFTNGVRIEGLDFGAVVALAKALS